MRLVKSKAVGDRVQINPKKLDTLRSVYPVEESEVFTVLHIEKWKTEKKRYYLKSEKRDFTICVFPSALIWVPESNKPVEL